MELEISPDPSDDEVAAIVAAHDALWPKPVAIAADLDENEATAGWRWRFSGRWWSKPVAMRRDRPTAP